MDSAIEKTLEHLRQIFFAYVVLLGTLVYITISVWRGSPDAIKRDLGALVAIAKEADDLKKMSLPPDQPLNPVARTAFIAFVEKVNQDFLASALPEIEAALKELADAASPPEVGKLLLAAYQPEIRFDVDPAQSLSTAQRDFSAAEIRLRGYKPVRLLSGKPAPLQEREFAELRSPELQPAQNKLVAVRKVVRTDHVPIDTNGRVRTIVVQVGSSQVEIELAPFTRRVSPAPSFEDAYPALAKEVAHAGELSLAALQARYLTKEAEVVRRKSAKVFDVEIEGEDVAVAISLVMVLAAAYLRAYLSALVSTLARVRQEGQGERATSARAKRVIWVGTHEGLAQHLVDGALLLAPVVIAIALWRLVLVQQPNLFTDHGWLAALGAAIAAVPFVAAWRSLKRARQEMDRL